MSEIRVNTIRDASAGNTSTTSQIFSGRSKAWVNFNGNGGVAIRSSFNVNSITDNGVGDYTVNFSSAQTDANYAVGGACSDGTPGSVMAVSPITYNSGSFRYTSWNGYDGTFQNIQVFR